MLNKSEKDESDDEILWNEVSHSSLHPRLSFGMVHYKEVWRGLHEKVLALVVLSCLPLPLISRQRALHRPCPSRQLPLPCRLAHVRLETMLEPPVVGEFRRLGIDAGRKPREIGGAECGGFLDHRTIDRSVEQVRKALHGPVRRGHAAVDAQ